MVLKKPRSNIAFVSPLPFCKTADRRRTCGARRTTRCAASKLLVVELKELLQHSNTSDLLKFSERVAVDRQRAKDTTYILYTSSGGYTSTMEEIRQAGLIEPDALAARDGLELYQKGYRTPDPYWRQKVGERWDVKPVIWVVETFFGEELKRGEDDGELVFVKEGEEEVGERVEGKLREMGVRGRVWEGGGEVRIGPDGEGVGKVVGFCQMMLRIEGEDTFVFGGERVVGECVKEGSCGILVGEGGEGERVFVAGCRGVDGLMEGVLHFAVF